MSALRRPRAVGFDYGRTLVDIGYPRPGLVRAGRELLRILGTKPPPGVAVEEVGIRVDAQVDRLVAHAHRRDPVAEVEIYSLYQRALQATLGVALAPEQVRQAADLLQLPWREAITVETGVIEALGALRGQGVRLGLLSNAPYQPRLMRGMLQLQGLSPYFDVILFSSEIGFRKPARAAFSALLGALGTEAEETWYVGDEPEADIEGARASGLLPLWAPGASAPDPAGSPETPRLSSFAELVSCWEAAGASR